MPISTLNLKKNIEMLTLDLGQVKSSNNEICLN